MNLPCHPATFTQGSPWLPLFKGKKKSRLWPGLIINHTISSLPAGFQQPSSHRPPLQVPSPFNTSHLAYPCSLQLPY